LACPQITPYKIMGVESYIVYLNRHRPDYFMIFPACYPPLVRSLALTRRVLHEVRLKDNVACGGGGHLIVAKPDWESFDSTFQNTGVLDVEPYVPSKSFKRRWYDAQERQGLFPDWRVYHMKAKYAEREGHAEQAEALYQTAESYGPQHHEFYLYMARFYQEKGDPSRAHWAMGKAIEYQLFPPP
jgi:hypothetical protein